MLYLLPIVVLLLPSILIGPIYSHVIAKGTIIFFTIFLIVRYSLHSHNEKHNLDIPQELIFLIVFYCIRLILLFPQSDVNIIIKSAMDIFFYIIFIIYMVFVAQHKEWNYKLKWVLFFIFLLYLINNLLFFVFKESYLLFFKPFFNEGSYSIILMNLRRGRIFFENFPELLVPFALFLIPQYILVTLALVGLSTFIVMVSGFRTNLIMLMTAIFLSFVVYKKNIKHVLHIFRSNIRNIPLIMTSAMILGIAIISTTSNQTIHFTALDRLISSEVGETSTIESRFYYIHQSVDLFMSNPLFGVGTDRFKEYLPYRKDKYSFSRSNLKIFNDARDPHNFLCTILSEGGLLTIMFYLSFLSKSYLIDIKRKTVGSIAFWTLFLYCLANPVSGFLQFNLLLIVFRFI